MGKKESRLKFTIMNSRKSHLVHWIAILAIVMSALAPAVTQAVSLAKHGQGFVMEVCSTDGSKLNISMQGDNSSDQTEPIQPCPYCVSHSDFVPTFSANVKFHAPQSFALFPELFYQSPKRLTVWITPPSAAPPSIT